MKSILYVGATLMIGASIYGFVDYKKQATTKNLKKCMKQKKCVQNQWTVIARQEKN